ncbi:MAG: glycyl-radical enzyme activating protein [Thermoanaerobaculales bacterium]|jgi:pyruvate formate lyase activating enzyme|nr:glycyl-radical enzyme activating protein [Thermoanaerobaculales bacterium]
MSDAARPAADPGHAHGVAVFNIQRCSVHDGPGIRTTVFLKGCPLRCDWCHNPESLDGEPEVAISGERCIACGACVDACPESGGVRPARGPDWDDGTCRRCGACAEACPGEARELIGEPRAVAELVAELERDRPFFDASGGGVTFSGGEPLCHPSFLAACLEACRERGLHTAVDTSGFAPARVMREIARRADVLLYDLKHLDPEAHRRHTGVDNAVILDNLRELSAGGAELWIRFPLVPGFNDDPDHLDALAAFVGSLPGRHPVFVLPYHAAGADKWRRLGKPGPPVEHRPPTDAELAAVAERLRSHDLDVRLTGDDV